MHHVRFLALMFALVPLASLGWSEEAEPQPADPATAAAFEYLQGAEEAMTAAREASRSAPRDDPAAREKASSDYREARESASLARESFRKSFAASNWKAWALPAFADLLEEGLWEVGYGALQDGEPGTAVRALELLVERLPDCEHARTALVRALPWAYLLQDGVAQAVAKTAQRHEAAQLTEDPEALMVLGDLRGLAGDLEGAQADFKAMMDLVNADEALAKTAAGRYGPLRDGLVGKTAPEIDSDNWLGGEAQPLSKLNGKVVLVDFWATWCGPCRRVMPHLNTLSQDKKDSPFEVLGVTRFYPSGFLPDDEAMTSGESVRDMDEEAFQKHIAEFRERSGIQYPFVVGTEENFKDYGIRGIPTLVVLDRSGVVRFVKVGSGLEQVLSSAIAHLLAEKASPDGSE